MKAVIRQAAETTSFDLEEIDIDTSRDLQALYGDQVPVLFIDGRKAFKYRVSAEQLAKRIRRKPSGIFTDIASFLRKGSL
jgi:hypothetical protein